jgi:flagellar biosynthesis protein FlhF
MVTKEDLQQLRVKSYFAASFQDAMEQARREMGQDALLLNSRKAPPEARHLGEVEVVFGSTVGTVGTPFSVPPVESGHATDDVQQNLRDIRNLLTRIAASPPGTTRSRYSAIEQTLMEAGVEPALALDIEESVRERMRKRGVVEIGKPRAIADWRVEELLEEAESEIACRFEVDTRLGRVTALVGPPGCGKTTTLIKLALTEGLMAGRTVRLISADTQQIGAAERLRTYAGILGVRFQAVESTTALALAVDSGADNELLLVDTPGFSAFAQEKSGNDLASLLSDRQKFDVHLVLTASMRAADMARTADRFAAFGPTKVLFTKIDETDSLAPVFCEAVRQRRPLSFLSSGQVIPDDIAPASKEQIAGSLVRKLPEVLKLVA